MTVTFITLHMRYFVNPGTRHKFLSPLKCPEMLTYQLSQIKKGPVDLISLISFIVFLITIKALFRSDVSKCIDKITCGKTFYL